jgi:long-chain acyl-CoA synthetase
MALGMRNYPEFCTALWAGLTLGVVVVPLNAWWSASELRAALRDSEASLLIVDEERAERIAPVLGELAALRHVITVRTRGTIRQSSSWEDVMRQLDPAAELPDEDVSSDDPATILYTSGTTRGPKGVLHTHRNHCSHIMNSSLMGEVRQRLDGSSSTTRGAQPGGLGHMPLFHIGMLGGLFASVASGAKVVLTRKWDPDHALDLIARERLTSFGGVPLHYQDLLSALEERARVLSTVTTVEFGGMAAPPALVLRARSRFGRQAQPKTSYGMTEASSGVTFIWGDDYLDRPDSVGWAGPATAAKVVDDAGSELPAGSVGELLVSGPNIVQGYWQRPAETKEAFTDDGWHRSGDLATIDDDGVIRIVGRTKDLVIRSGENIHCVEVEAALYEHPAVEAVAVFGIPHERFGEELVAVVNLREDVSEGDLQAFVGERLARFKIPTKIACLDEDLPRNATGKLMKRTLRDWALAGRILNGGEVVSDG